MMPLSTTLEQSVPLSAAFEKHLIASPGERVKHFNRNSLNLGTANRLRDLQMDFGRFNADQFRHQLMNYTEAELIKLGRSVSSAASRCLDPMTQQLNASKYELCRQEWRRRHPK